MTQLDPAQLDPAAALLIEYGQWRNATLAEPDHQPERIARRLAQGVRLALRMKTMLQSDEATLALHDAYNDLDSDLSRLGEAGRLEAR